MRLRLTLFLIFANIALFVSIWFLEREPAKMQERTNNVLAFTMLEISGKGIDKPRILKFENNNWRIVSPIDWRANHFAVNRIRNQIEFLDKEVSFPLSELKTRGADLSSYGLDDPAYLIKYGSEKKMCTLRIGKSAPVGDKIYMLDEENEKIIVVDKAFVNGLVVDTERLRNQNVFDIQSIEVSAFSIRLPSVESTNTMKGNFRRIGLVRDGVLWKFETPILAEADSNKVSNFLRYICQLSAKGLNVDSVDANFDVSTLPITLTIEGTNRRQVLLLGKKTKDEKHIYAKLEGNPTIFTLDASIVKDLTDVQTSLRERAVAKLDINKITSITISKDGKTLKFGKLKSGEWDVIAENSKESANTYKADASKINKILMAVSETNVREFVSDAPGELARYGISQNSLRITAFKADQTATSLIIGKEFDLNGTKLVYAKAGNSDAIYGISDELVTMLSTNLNDYRSRILDIMPDKAELKSLVLTDLKTGKDLMNIDLKNGSFDVSKYDVRQRVAIQKLIDYAKKFVVRKYLSDGFDEKGAFAVGKMNPWIYELKATFDVRGTNSTVSETRSWLLSKRIGGMTQYGGSKKFASTFILESVMIDSIFEFTQKTIESAELKKADVVAPKKK